MPSTTHPDFTTMAELSGALGDVGARYTARGSRLGYFAALYETMTRRVAAGVAAGRFSDGALMERLACHFAGRYLSAVAQHEAGDAPPRCWAVAFEAAERWRPVILQHLLLGMNAHINFDLGIAVAEVADGDARGVAELRPDFLEINEVLAELLSVVERRIESVSPWMWLLDRVGGCTETAVINFSMGRARDAAWSVAERFAALPAEQRPAAEARLDHEFAEFADVIRKPGALVTLALLPARLREQQDVGRVIEALLGPPETSR